MSKCPEYGQFPRKKQAPKPNGFGALHFRRFEEDYAPKEGAGGKMGVGTTTFFAAFFLAGFFLVAFLVAFFFVTFFFGVFLVAFFLVTFFLATFFLVTFFFAGFFFMATPTSSWWPFS
jgi:hypothetical protein